MTTHALLNAEPTQLPGVLVLRPTRFTDARGVFVETCNADAMHRLLGLSAPFVQDNLARSRRGVVRGLHYQLPPRAQGKLIRVARGSVFDVAVDVRRSSPTFGQWAGMHVNAADLLQIWIPPGFAHGYLVLEDDTDVVYKVTDHYAPEYERSIAWNDPAIGIGWPSLDTRPVLSHKDAAAPRLAHADTFL